MRITRKLVGFLAAASIATSTVAAISASCSFVRRPKEKYEMPIITYEGETTISPGEGVKTATIAGFSLSRQLYTGEKIRVEIVDPANAIPLSAKIADMDEDATDFAIDLNADIPETEKYNNSEYKFSLQFYFEYDGVEYKYDGDKDAFTFKYTGIFQDITVEGEGKTYETDKTNNKQFTVADFKLSRKLRIDTEEGGYDESFNISSTNDNIQVISWNHSKDEDKPTISITLQVVDCDDYDDYEQDFGLIFTFYNHDVLKPEYTITKNNLHVKYNREWQDNELHLEGENRVFAPEAGQLSVSSAAGTFYLDRGLKTKYNEKLEISLGEDASTVFPEGYDGSYTLDNFNKPTCSVTSNSVIVTLSLKNLQNDNDKYLDLEFKNLILNWKISEGDSEKNSGTFVISFQYRKVIYDNNVLTNYSGEVNLEPEVGVNGWSFVSYASKSQQTNWFKYANRLENDVEVTVAAIPEEEYDEDDPIVTASSLTKVRSVDEQTDYINFSLTFDRMPTSNYSKKVKLVFTFSRNGDSFSKTLGGDANPVWFTLYYKQPEIVEEDYIPSLKAEYRGVNHGDTIISVDGSITSEAGIPEAWEPGEDYTIAIDPEKSDPGISFIKGTEGEGYEQGYRIDNKDILMYVRIDDSEDEFDATAERTYNVTFNFTFGNSTTHSIQTKIVYEPFDPTLEAYLKARTMPINMRFYYSDFYQSGYQRINGTAFILSKAPGDDEEISKNGHKYYIATTMDYKHTMDYWRKNYSSYSQFKMGITDDRFKSTYSYNEGDSDSPSATKIPWTACDYRYDYIYCDPSSITWEPDSSFKWDDNQTYSCDIAVAKIDFEKLINVTQTVSNEKIIAYINKLNTLNNYYSVYGHINNWLDGPITAQEDPTGNNDPHYFANYSDNGFMYAGFSFLRHQVNDGTWYGNMTRSQWETNAIDAYNLQYQDAATYRASGIGKDDTVTYYSNYSRNQESTTKRGSPVYRLNSSINKTDQTYNNLSEFGVTALAGGMLAGKLNDAPVGKDNIYLLAIIRNGADDSTSKVVSGGTVYYTKYTPHFDIWDDGTTNLLQKYIEQN